VTRWLENSPNRSISLVWVKGHSGVYWNEKVDDLAKAACLLPSMLKGPTVTWLKQFATERVTRLWAEEWKEEATRSPHRWITQVLGVIAPTRRRNRLVRQTVANTQGIDRQEGRYGWSVYAAPTRKDSERKDRVKIHDAGIAYDRAPKQFVRPKEIHPGCSRCSSDTPFVGNTPSASDPNLTTQFGARAVRGPMQTREHIIVACPLNQEHRWRLNDASPHGDHIPSFNTLISTKGGCAAIAEF
jgi:hypothetical protein